MPWREIGNLGGILGRYTSFQQGMLSPSLHDDFASVLQFAPARALRFGLIETFSSPHTPSFAETLGQLYEHFDLRQRADLFNTILEVAPQVRELNFIKPLLSGTRLSVLTASSLDANDLMRLASEAEAINPGIIEEVTEFYARRPTMLIKLDRKSKGMILTTLAHVKIGELESLPKQGGNFEIRLPKHLLDKITERYGYEKGPEEEDPLSVTLSGEPERPAADSAAAEEYPLSVTFPVEPEEPPAAAAEPPGGGPPRTRQIVVTGHTASGDSVAAFEPETQYGLRFRVGMPPQEAANLAHGDLEVQDVPDAGLAGHWIVASRDVKILALVPAGKIAHVGDTDIAEFDLTIPAKGESDTVTVTVQTIKAGGELALSIVVGVEEYRKATVSLASGNLAHSDQVCTQPSHLNLRPPFEWTTPPEHIQIQVMAQAAAVTTLVGRKDYPPALWTANSAALKNPIDRVRKALDGFRIVATPHLNNLDVAEMEARLRGELWKPYDWAALRFGYDGPHDAAFSALASSDELRALANEGYNLYDTCFPGGSDLRKLFEERQPGSRIDFIWTKTLQADWVSHVPWALMYPEPVLSSQAVDCGKFFGLRYRIGSKSWDPDDGGNRALGDVSEVHTLNFLYWGSGPHDQVGVESQWQRSTFSTWPLQSFVPDPNSTDRKRDVIMALEAPQPAPAGILYFYCHCNVKDGSEPSLQFGDSATVQDVIDAADIYQGRLDSGPLVFANACTTVASHPQGTSELESRFFRRGVRAFLGTETKVPEIFASRFAWLFFQFFLRKAAEPKPMPAGEALAQARMFLWTQYRNPGGLFYSLTNQYNLYLASGREVESLSKPGK